MTTITDDTLSDLVPGGLTLGDLLEACTPQLLADRTRLALTGDNRYAYAFGTLRPAVENVLDGRFQLDGGNGHDLRAAYATAHLLTLTTENFGRLVHRWTSGTPDFAPDGRS